MSAQCSAVAAATAAAAAGAVLGLGVARVFPLVASLTDAPPPCQAQLYFVARLEPTRVRWKSDQVHTTRLETGKQMCRSASVSSLCTIQQQERERKRDREKQRDREAAEKMWEKKDREGKPETQRKNKKATLWCSVPARGDVICEWWASANLSRQSKIRELHYEFGTRLCHQQVLRLHVSVEVSVFVHVMQGL